MQTPSLRVPIVALRRNRISYSAYHRTLARIAKLCERGAAPLLHGSAQGNGTDTSHTHAIHPRHTRGNSDRLSIPRVLHHG